MDDHQHAEQRVCYRCLVAGRVQGVFFRASAREQAMRLGVTGYAKNLPDGRVEVLVCGEAHAVTQLRDWLRSGPSAARVTGVACEPLDYASHADFVID
ncbi:acylphosphatase [Thiorhodococcus minor]|uniref:Acylphosphatase n=1 Tax=Thiorhodococcus minor TaxID=57489 RepID=A0A6M0JX97_9GAMM|nr:acylphosphatase [Thiorhodococcus minor]NEV62140.1 acylphosphatase [Thiorhodococcus minor]